MSELRLCWTCGRCVENAEAATCGRKWCTAKVDVERARGKSSEVRPPQRNPGELPDLRDTYDQWQP